MPRKTKYELGRADALAEVEALVRDFSWSIPMYTSREVNEATDDTAVMVTEQIAEAIAKLRKDT